MKTVGTYYSIENAERARLELLSIGVEATIENEFSATIAPHLMLGASGSVKLLVEESEFEEAVNLLSEFKANVRETDYSPPFARYRFAILIGALGGLLVDQWIVGIIGGVASLAALVTIYNYGIEKGYRAGKTELE